MHIRNNKLDSGFECKLAEPLDCTDGTLGFRGTLVENHCAIVFLTLFQGCQMFKDKII